MLHAFFALGLPNFATDTPKQQTLVVELMQQAPPPPPPAPEPPKPLIKPAVKPVIIPTETKTDATPPPPPEVIAAAPQVDAPPPTTPPVAIAPREPPKPVVVPVDTSAARDNYNNALWSAIVKHKQYPRIAQMRGWQGEAVVELQIDGNGKLKSKRIVQSSGHDVLDKQALDMVEKALPFPAPPEVLRGSSFSVKVPIAFKLE
ncbi:MAG: energy transducer TonB [Methylotenera sp.]|nr:energy transducer TonB [Methylotenera sp.]